MKTLNSTVAALALLAGTALTPVATYAQDQLGTDMDQSQGMDQGSDDELLLKNQRENQSSQSDETTMPDAQQQDQAESNEAQDPATQTEDQATDEDLLKKRNQSQDEAASPRSEPQTEDTAQDPSRKTDQDRTAQDRDRARQEDADQNTATDTRRKSDDATASDDNRKTEENENQASSSNKPSNETTGSINISAEQKTVIKNTIVEANVKPVDIDFKVSIGVNVPKKVVLHPLPAKVIEIVPAYRNYVYFILADGRIVIVQPDTYKVVYILVV